MIDYQNSKPFLIEKKRIISQFILAGVPAEQAETVADCFATAANVPDLEELKALFNEGVAKIRQEENKVKSFTHAEFSANQRKVQEIVRSVVGNQA